MASPSLFIVPWLPSLVLAVFKGQPKKVELQPVPDLTLILSLTSMYNEQFW